MGLFSRDSESTDSDDEESLAEQLIRDAYHKSVNKERLTSLKAGLMTRYLYDKAIIEYLNDDEQPNFILAARMKAPVFEGENVPTWSGDNLDGMAMHMITDSRWIIVAGMESGDEIFSIGISDISDIQCTTSTTDHEVELQTEDGLSLTIPIGNMYDADEVEEAVDYVRALEPWPDYSLTHNISDRGETPFKNESTFSKTSRNHGYLSECENCGENDVWWAEKGDWTYLLCGNCGALLKSDGKQKPVKLWEKVTDGDDEPELENRQYPREIINRSRHSNNALYAKLIVPTKSSGATFTSRGWNVGGDIIRRTTSKGEVEENPWENYVKKFIIHEGSVEIGVTHGDLSLTSDNQIHQTMRIDLADISDVRVQLVEGRTGFIFETASDVYQFKLTKVGKMSSASRSDANEAVRTLKKAISEAPEPEESYDENQDSSNESSAVEKLSQIKELHNDGVLTDEEFQEKKSELLDQI